MAKEEPLRVTVLEAKNFKRLSAIRIEPDGSVVRLEGKNGAGKSCAIDALCATLGGGKWQPDEPVRRGQAKAQTVVEIGDLTITRKWTTGGTTRLEVTRDGVVLASPQKVLDPLFDDLAFDPLDFTRMTPKEQGEVLRRLVGLDFTALDDERAKIFVERTNVNRDVKTTAARVGEEPLRPKPDTPIDVRGLADKQQEALAHNRNVDNTRGAYERAGEQARDLERQIADLTERLATMTALADEHQTSLATLKPVDIGDLGAEISKAEGHNRALEAYEAWDRQRNELDALETTAETLTDRIEAIDAEKVEALAAAKFPLEGLSLDAGAVTLKDIPFSQASSAEQLRTAVAIGLAGKPKARIAFIRDGSLLDQDGMAALHDIAKEFKAQIWVERVADTRDPAAVWIEDGEIVE